MAKEILFYSPIYDFTAADYINQLEANKGNDISVRMNCPGGNVYAGIGCIAKFNEFPKGKVIKVDGQAKSGGFYMCVCADEVEALDVSDFMVHRAAYPEYVESNPKIFTDEVKAELTKHNNKLRAMMEVKVSDVLFQSVTGVSYDQLFSLDSRIDVNLTAQQMKTLGLISKVTPLNKGKKSEIMALAASHGVAAFSNIPDTQSEEIKPNTTMTAAEFKAAHPAAHAEIVQASILAERDRVGSWMAFAEVDPVAVKAGIEAGAEISRTQMSEFSVKAYSKNALAAVEADSAAAIVTAEIKPAEAQAKADEAAFAAEVKANLKKIMN